MYKCHSRHNLKCVNENIYILKYNIRHPTSHPSLYGDVIIKAEKITSDTSRCYS